MLRKYLWDASHVLSYETIDVDPELSYQEQLAKILDRKEKELRNKTILLWRSFGRIMQLRSNLGIRRRYEKEFPNIILSFGDETFIHYREL